MSMNSDLVPLASSESEAETKKEEYLLKKMTIGKKRAKNTDAAHNKKREWKQACRQKREEFATQKEHLKK